MTDPLQKSAEGTDAHLKKWTLRCKDGHKYYKNNSNKRKTAMYFRCHKHKSGCIAKVYTNYSDKKEDWLQVNHSCAAHNHKI